MNTEYRIKPVVVQALTFAQLVAHGRAHGANIVNGMPWSFTYRGHAVSHENDERYLVSTREGTLNVTPSDMLVTSPDGQLYVTPAVIFNQYWEAV